MMMCKIPRRARRQRNLRFRSNELSNNFEGELELTCLDEHLPPESRSRGGQLLADDGCRSGLYKKLLEVCKANHRKRCESSLSGEMVQKLASMVKLCLIDDSELKVIVEILLADIVHFPTFGHRGKL